MTMESQRLAVAASFAERYYNAMVESPSSLPLYYAPTAAANHLNNKAKGHADVSKLLATTHTNKSYASVTVESLSVTCTTTGNIVAAVTGSLSTKGENAAAQRFTHEVELRETHPQCYLIVRDVFRHVKAAAVNQQTVNWASATPLMFASTNQVQEAAMEPLQQPASTAETHAAAAASSTASHNSHKSPAKAHADPAAAAPAKPAEPAVDLSKLSFAERLRLTKGQTPQASAAPIRVSDKAAAAQTTTTAAGSSATEGKPAKKSEKKSEHKKEDAAGAKKPHTKAAAAHNEKPKDAKKDKETGAAGKPKKAPASRAAQPLVFYDIIIKGLPDQATEEEVRAMVKPDARVSKVKVESKASRRDPTDTRTFAFIQLERDGLTEDVKVVVAAIIDHAKQHNLLGEKVVMEEVHERKAVPAEKHSTQSTSTPIPS